MTGYTVAGKTSCYIHLYYRGNPTLADDNGQVGKLKIMNMDTSNGMWANVEKQISGNISGYTLNELTLSNTGAKYQQSGEPSSATTVTDDFDTSTLIS